MAEGSLVLVVDDEPDIVETLASFLQENLGVRVAGAGSADEALAVARKEPPVLVLADYRMPGRDGLELLEACAREFPDAGRILMTAYPDMDLALTALERARIVGFLTKPLDPKKVLALVRGLTA
jgi:DNA-binding NtrC family response regulator